MWPIQVNNHSVFAENKYLLIPENDKSCISQPKFDRKNATSHSGPMFLILRGIFPSKPCRPLMSSHTRHNAYPYQNPLGNVLTL